MAVPTSRDSFKEYCLRKLGKPVIEINVSDEQVDDRVDEALRYFYDYHFDGSEKVYYKYEVTAQTKIDRYLTMPDNIIGVVNLFPISQTVNSTNMFDIRYQIALNDLYTLTSVSMVPFVMAMQHISMLEQLLVGQQPLRYNKHVNKLYVDANWSKLDVGDFIVAEAYQVVDPDVYTKTWSDRWLQRYATALIKSQWGSNLSKFSQMQLPGGVMFNGDKIFNDAETEIKKLEDEMVNSWSLPAADMIGAVMLCLTALPLLSGFV